MPRRGPTTGAKPNRGQDQTSFAEDIWNWLKTNQNLLLLGGTITIVGIVLLVIRSRSTRKTHNQAQEAVGEFFYDAQQKEDNLTKRVKRIQSRISRFQGVPELVPWMRLQLASVYYENSRYDEAAKVLRTLQKKHKESQPAELAGPFLNDLQKEQAYMSDTITRKKESLNRTFERKKRIFNVSDKDLSKLSEASTKRRPPSSLNRP